MQQFSDKSIEHKFQELCNQYTKRAFLFTLGHICIAMTLNILYFFEDWFYDDADE